MLDRERTVALFHSHPVFVRQPILYGSERANRATQILALRVRDVCQSDAQVLLTAASTLLEEAKAKLRSLGAVSGIFRVPNQDQCLQRIAAKQILGLQVLFVLVEFFQD